MSTRVRWLGHSCLLFETQGKHVLVDPFLTGNPKAAAQAEEVPADLILLSHGHGDHVGDTVAIAKRTGATVVTNYEIGEWLKAPAQGLEKVHGMQHGGGLHFEGIGRVKLTLAFHGSVLPDGTYGGNPCGFLIKFDDGTTVYDAADTALFSDMALIGEEGVDLALLPIGDYYTMGPDDAVRAVKLIGPKAVMPIHYNTFGPIVQDAKSWADKVRGATKAEPVVLEPGDWYEIK
ncbi:metal-dependent hydrolase [Singulisphaera sp. PoT]|uniref:metal-dependent hydrolase n=1 Tax=Singulisphaera sp. PoT TaxID=3411797 RepID=UPI003BF54817